MNPGARTATGRYSIKVPEGGETRTSLDTAFAARRRENARAWYAHVAVLVQVPKPARSRSKSDYSSYNSPHSGVVGASGAGTVVLVDEHPAVSPVQIETQRCKRLWSLMRSARKIRSITYINKVIIIGVCAPEDTCSMTTSGHRSRPMLSEVSLG